MLGFHCFLHNKETHEDIGYNLPLYMTFLLIDTHRELVSNNYPFTTLIVSPTRTTTRLLGKISNGLYNARKLESTTEHFKVGTQEIQVFQHPLSVKEMHQVMFSAELLCPNFTLST